MGKVVEIGIAKNKGDQIINVSEIEVIENQGIAGDRYKKERSDKKTQITLIEMENINFYNQISNTSIQAIYFRRNIVTENIKLNELVGKTFHVGKVKVIAHDLCRPCKYLQNLLKQNNLIKEFLHKGGLRCEILSSGTIYVGDIIK